MAYDKPIPISTHISELRSRVLYCFIFFIFFSIIGYLVSDYIISFLAKPYPDNLFFLSPTDMFMLVTKISLFFGLLVSLPIIIYHIWKFIAVMFNKKVKHSIFVYLVFSFFLLIISFFFAVKIIIPTGLQFLLNFGTNLAEPLVSINNYFSFVFTIILAFAILFQLPIVLIFLIKTNILTVEMLSKNRRYVILITFIVAAILTPPDVFTQVALAIPLLILFEISLLICRFFK